MAGAGESRRHACLKTLCFHAVRKHFAVIGAKAVLDLPEVLIKELLFHLTVCDVLELEPELNLKGISTRSFWLRVRQDVFVSHTSDFQTDEELREDVLRPLFECMFYKSFRFSFHKHVSDRGSFLRTAAKYINSFRLCNPDNSLERLVAEQRPLLALLEKRLGRVTVSMSLARPDGASKSALCVLHRLLDHGAARRVVLQVDCPVTLACLLYGEGLSPDTDSRQDSAEEPSNKRQRLESESDSHPTVQLLHTTLRECAAGGACARGRLEQLEVHGCGKKSLQVLISSLPKLHHLRSLTLHGKSSFTAADMFGLSVGLVRLSTSGSSSLSEVTITELQQLDHLYILLDTSPGLKSISIEVTHAPLTEPMQETPVIDRVVPLEKLSVRAAHVWTDERLLVTTLKRCPRLCSLHLAGLRASPGSSHKPFLSSLAESSRCLTHLHLEDLNLSNCLDEIVHLLRRTRLEELHLKDCRLLERCGDQQEVLRQLVEAVKAVTSLHTLGLAQNRIATNVCVLGELFSGASPSTVRKLDLSSNFIRPAELLRFSEAIHKNPPPHKLTLDLRTNPGDRDPDSWKAVLKRLNTFCTVVVEVWKSTCMMDDYISNM